MSLAVTQQTASTVSQSAVVNGLVLAPLHPNVNYEAQKNRKGVCLSQWARLVPHRTDVMGSLRFASQE